MSSKTKIVVLHMKEVVYSILFLVLALLFGIVIFLMFRSGDTAQETAGDGLYSPGVYRSSISLNDNTFDVEVTVGAGEIQDIRLVNLSESTAAAFPLMEPALDSLAAQIYETQSLENLTYSEDNKYTSMMLLNAISSALEKAKSEGGSSS